MTDFEKTYDKVKKDMPPFDGWEKLDGESAAAYAAFCLFRDYGPDHKPRSGLPLCAVVPVAQPTPRVKPACR